jgi:hypothetical protein
MYFFAHAMAGILIGLVLAALTGDRRVVALAALGAVLPDLIDKPLGHIILAGTVNYGRIYFHGLTVLSLFVLAGLLVVAAGMASHQVLDGMWHNPVVWFWPFLGPIPRQNYPRHYLREAIWRQLSQPSEWIFLFLITVLFAVLYRQELKTVIARITSPSVRRTVFAVLCLAALTALVVGWQLLL